MNWTGWLGPFSGGSSEFVGFARVCLKSGGRVTSNRFGIDAYFTAGLTISMFSMPFKTALMRFYFYEKVNLVASKASEVAASDFDISSINYTAGYAGTGLVISW